MDDSETTWMVASGSCMSYIECGKSHAVHSSPHELCHVRKIALRSNGGTLLATCSVFSMKTVASTRPCQEEEQTPKYEYLYDLQRCEMWIFVGSVFVLCDGASASMGLLEPSVAVDYPHSILAAI